MLVHYRRRLDGAIGQWQALREHDLVALNAQLKQNGLQEIHVPAPEEIRDDGPAESKDLP